MVLFTQDQLADRWQISPRTLEQWRWLGKGPKFMKVGARVLYREPDVTDYEASHICQNTSGPLPREAI
jgi:hypothetical protein